MKSVMNSRTLQALSTRARIAGLIVAVAFAGLFMAACKDSGPLTVASVTISPTSATIAVGGTVQFTVVVRDNEGNVLSNTPSWSVTGGGSITQTGLFTAGQQPGTSTITVTCRGVTATAVVTVTPGPLLRIAVLPQTTTLVQGATQQFTATGRDAFNNVVAITPVWTVANPPGTIGASTGLFTAGSTLGSFPNSVRASVGAIFDEADVIVVAGPLLTIAVLPQTTTLNPGGTQQFTATGRDANNNVVPITPVWTVRPGNDGSINSSTGLFTAGPTIGSFPNTVRASVGAIFDEADVIVVPTTPPPPPSGGFTILGRTAVTCSLGSIIGDIGTFQAAGDAPPGTITASCGPVTTGTVHAPGDPATKTAYNNFLAAYIARAPVPGDCDAAHTLSGTLAGTQLAPGTYCFTAGAALTGVLTLNGPTTGVWLFKVGTSGTGGLTGSSFDVIMAGGATACNVTWWVQQAAAMTDSNLKGTMMAGTGVTVTNGTLIGNMWAGASGTGDATETGAAVTGCP